MVRNIEDRNLVQASRHLRKKVNKVNNMIKHAREQFLLSGNELVDSLKRNDSKSYWSLIWKLMKGTSQHYSIPPLYDKSVEQIFLFYFIC